MGRRIQHPHLPRRAERKQDNIVQSGGCHHRVQIVGPALQTSADPPTTPDPKAPYPAGRTTRPWRTMTAAQTTTDRVGTPVRDFRDPGTTPTPGPPRSRAARPPEPCTPARR